MPHKELISMPFGKHKGTKFSELPEKYVKWMLKQEWLKPDLKSHLENALNNGLTPTLKRHQENGELLTEETSPHFDEFLTENSNPEYDSDLFTYNDDTKTFIVEASSLGKKNWEVNSHEAIKLTNVFGYKIFEYKRNDYGPETELVGWEYESSDGFNLYIIND